MKTMSSKAAGAAGATVASGWTGFWKMLALIAAAVLTMLCVGTGVRMAIAATLEGTYDDGQALYTYSIKSGEASITHIEKSPKNEATTYEAIIPDKVSHEGGDCLVTEIAANVMGYTWEKISGVGEVYEEEVALAKLSVPAKVRSIGEQAFVTCVNLTEVEFRHEEVTSTDDQGNETIDFVCYLQRVESQAFYMASKVKVWTLPDSLTYGGSGAFGYYNMQATEVRLPATNTTWAGTFGYLPNCTSLIIPEGCTSLPIMYSLTSLESLSIPGTVEGVVSLNGTTNLKELNFPEVVKFDTLRIGGTQLETLVVPQGVKIIDVAGGVYKTIQLPDTLEIIESISSCPAEEVIIPAGVHTLEDYAFVDYNKTDDCPKRIIVEDMPENPSQLINVGRFAFCYCRSLEYVSLGSKVDFLNIPFSECNSLVDVTLPAGLTRVVSAFESCENLEVIRFSENSVIEYIEKLAAECPNLREVYLPASASKTSYAEARYYFLTDCPKLEAIYTLNANIDFTEKSFVNCGIEIEGRMKMYGWGMAGLTLDYAEDEGFEFVPYATLDANNPTGESNVTARVLADGTIEASMAFSTPLSYDYERDLSVENGDFTAKVVEEDGVRYVQLTGNGITCYGTVRLLCSQSIEGAQIGTIATQVLADGQPACPKVRVTLGGIALTEGEHYTLSYENNDEPGTAKVVLTGAGLMTGTAEATFTVKGAYAVQGSDRTANTLAGDSTVTSADVVVAWNHDSAACAAASACAAAQGCHLLTVSNTGLDDATLAWVKSWGAKSAYVVGGSAACGAATVSALQGAGLTCTQLEVASAAEAAQALAAKAGALTAAVLMNPADTALLLPAAAYAGTAKAALLFTAEDGTVSAATAKLLQQAETVVVLGDALSVDASVTDALSDAQRIQGATTQDTAAALAEHGLQTGAYSQVSQIYLVSSADSSSFIGQALPASRAGAPVILVQDVQSANIPNLLTSCTETLTSYRVLERTPGTLSQVEARVQALLGW